MQVPKQLCGKALGEAAKGRRLASVGVLIGLFLWGALLLGAPAKASAAGCVDLGGAIVGLECQLSAQVVKSGTFDLTETLHILGTGGVTTNGADLTINSPNDIILDAGAFINANSEAVCPNGRAGNVTLTADADGDLVGNVLVANGASVTSNAKCTGGEIIIAGVQIDIKGLVESTGRRSGSGAQSVPAGGGPISLNADCTLLIDDTGKVSSRGRDTGADRVHLQGGCQVKVYGLVESTAIGHHPGPANLCTPPSRPDKPSNTKACVEIWAGENTLNGEPSVVIDGLTHNGQINADLAVNPDTGNPAGGFLGIQWVDIFSPGDILILGPTDTSRPFAIHANGFSGTNDSGGIVTVKSLGTGLPATGIVTAQNRTVQSNGSDRGGIGGTVTIESNANANLNTMILEAVGDFNSVGGIGQGGIASIRSFNGALNWQNGNGDVRPAASGAINLTACVAVVTTGTNFNGTVPSTATGVCGGSPTVAAYVVFPPCACEPIIAPCVCIEDVTRNGNLLTIFGNGSCSGGFLGDPADPADDITLVGFSATCEPSPVCTATVNPATRTNATIEVTVPGCAVPGNFIIVGIDGPFPNPTYRSFSCLKAGLQP
jgi:hypothetical protein